MDAMKPKNEGIEDPKREKVDCVLSFRVPERILLDLKAQAASVSAGSSCSANQYARKIILEFLAGHHEPPK
jgi:hypothetical protein